MLNVEVLSCAPGHVLDICARRRTHAGEGGGCWRVLDMEEGAGRVLDMCWTCAGRMCSKEDACWRRRKVLEGAGHVLDVCAGHMCLKEDACTSFANKTHGGNHGDDGCVGKPTESCLLPLLFPRIDSVYLQMLQQSGTFSQTRPRKKRKASSLWKHFVKLMPKQRCDPWHCLIKAKRIG
eukprot:1142394-Pelagomonas_calceolata.AAC.3